MSTSDPVPPPSDAPLDAAALEARWSQAWEAARLHAFDPGRGREETFVIDTPPPTVSGSLHVGHVFSYTHADVIARQRRMAGMNLFYPMGWDDNGLPTERRVQNHFHVRVDVRTPYDPALRVQPVPAEEARTRRPQVVSRPNFIALCHQVTGDDEKAFEALWRRIGLSVDWSLAYATIDDHCRRTAQLSFLDLFARGHLYSVFAPTMWDVDFQTAVAQAEVEERPQGGAFHELAFDMADGPERFAIATTRPELLPACVAITAHPDDPRYRALIGRTALTPLFRTEVPVFASPLVDPEKGTGILMVCTFGDNTDVTWWREQQLPLRQVIGRDGRFQAVAFGSPGWHSRDPAAADAAYQPLVGKTVKQARVALVERLRDPAASAIPGRGAPLQGEPRPIERAVKFFEKGDQPLELLPTRQWFVRLLDKKERLLEMGARIAWHPEFMAQRYRNWVEGLQFDWCISRQRYFGVPFPVWYALDGQGRPQYDQPLLATAAQLPVDPTVTVPEGFRPEERDQPGGFTAETDVFDTWFTSSLTPQITSGWPSDPDRHRRLFPGDLRPQSHEIIRTWAFYTIAKALLHEETVPWHHVAVSGWILDPDRKKMSKSRGNVVTPTALIDSYTADGVRYWAASARLGTDTAFDEKMLKVGKRLATKIFNVGKFVLGQGQAEGPVTEELDRAFLHRLAALVTEVNRHYQGFDYASALAATEGFFWKSLADTYLELVKVRARGESRSGAAGRASAVVTLRQGLDVLLRLFAPVLPFITEEVWSWLYAGPERPFVHRAAWPTTAELAAVPPPQDPGSLELAAAMMAAVNKRKTELGASVGRMVSALTVGASPATLARTALVAEDVAAAVRARALETVPGELTEGAFTVVRCDVEPAPRRDS